MESKTPLILSMQIGIPSEFIDILNDESNMKHFITNHQIARSYLLFALYYKLNSLNSFLDLVTNGLLENKNEFTILRDDPVGKRIILELFSFTWENVEKEFSPEWDEERIMKLFCNCPEILQKLLENLFEGAESIKTGLGYRVIIQLFIFSYFIPKFKSDNQKSLSELVENQKKIMGYYNVALLDNIPPKSKTLVDAIIKNGKKSREFNISNDKIIIATATLIKMFMEDSSGKWELLSGNIDTIENFALDLKNQISILKEVEKILEKKGTNDNSQSILNKNSLQETSQIKINTKESKKTRSKKPFKCHRTESDTFRRSLSSGGIKEYREKMSENKEKHVDKCITNPPNTEKIFNIIRTNSENGVSTHYKILQGKNSPKNPFAKLVSAEQIIKMDSPKKKSNHYISRETSTEQLLERKPPKRNMFRKFF